MNQNLTERATDKNKINLAGIEQVVAHLRQGLALNAKSFSMSAILLGENNER